MSHRYDARSPAEELSYLRPATSSPGKSTLTSRYVARRARDDNGVAPDAETAIQRASSSSGAPLPGALRSQFEGSLGTSLEGVRVHTGEASATAADAAGARAYATGQDIHFGAGQYDPGSESGQFLIAHEVAHTVQQSGATARPQFKLDVSSPGDAAEVEADEAARAMITGRSASVSGSSGVARKVYRDAAPAYKSEFGANGGSAGVMDQMAVKAADKVNTGLPAVAIDAGYPLKQAQQMEDTAASLSNASIPGAGTVGTSNTGVHIYEQQSAAYIADAASIETAEAGYSQAIGPSVLAAKGFAALKSVAHDSLGLVDEHAAGSAAAKADQIDNQAYKDIGELGGNLSASQKSALGGILAKENPVDHTNVLATMNGNVATAEGEVTSTRAGLTKNALTAQQGALKKLEGEQKAKAAAKGEEKDVIEKKIEAIIDAADKVGTIAKVATTICTGDPGDVTKLVTNGTASMEKVEETGGTVSKLKADGGGIAETGGSLLTQVAGDFAKTYYEHELNVLNTAIDTAGAAITLASERGVELGALIGTLELKALAAELVSRAQTLAAKLNARKHFLAVEGAQADKKASKGDKNKDSISQLLLLLSNAKDARGLLADAKTQATTADAVVAHEIPHMEKHREELLPTMQNMGGFVVAGKPIHAGSSNDPDISGVRQMEINLESWQKVADEQDKYAATLESKVEGLAPKSA
jgi:hypothetical protein